MKGMVWFGGIALAAILAMTYVAYGSGCSDVGEVPATVAVPAPGPTMAPAPAGKPDESGHAAGEEIPALAMAFRPEAYGHFDFAEMRAPGMDKLANVEGIPDFADILAPAFISVRTNPEGLRLYINEINTGLTTPVDHYPVRSGQVEMKIKFIGVDGSCYVYVDLVAINPGEDREIMVDFQKHFR